MYVVVSEYISIFIDIFCELIALAVMFLSCTELLSLQNFAIFSFILYFLKNNVHFQQAKNHFLTKILDEARVDVKSKKPTETMLTYYSDQHFRSTYSCGLKGQDCYCLTTHCLKIRCSVPQKNFEK